MDAAKIKRENQRLKRQLREAHSRAKEADARVQEAAAQQTELEKQFAQTIAEVVRLADLACRVVSTAGDANEASDLAIRKAFTYTLNQWSALCRYTEAGYLSFENNAAERLVKNPAIGRKNYLFVGRIRDGRDAAVFYSLVSSATANGVEPFAWLRDVFTKLPYHRDGEAFAQASASEPVTSNELDALLPDRWLQSHLQHTWTMDTIRRKERQAKEKTRRRNLRR